MTNDIMCPNCVTPWKCNGPHTPAAIELTCAEAFAQKISDYYCTFIIPQILARPDEAEILNDVDGSEIFRIIEQRDNQLRTSSDALADAVSNAMKCRLSSDMFNILKKALTDYEKTK